MWLVLCVYKCGRVITFLHVFVITIKQHCIVHGIALNIVNFSLIICISKLF